MTTATDTVRATLADAIYYSHNHLDNRLSASMDPEERITRAYIRETRMVRRRPSTPRGSATRLLTATRACLTTYSAVAATAPPSSGRACSTTG